MAKIGYRVYYFKNRNSDQQSKSGRQREVKELFSKRVKEPDTILLFFENHDENDELIPGDRYLRRLRDLIHNVRKHKQQVTGFERWFHLLVQALKSNGYKVLINDYRTARKDPTYPIGLIGYPRILGQYKQKQLSNPVVLGPALFDHPAQFESYKDMFRKYLYLVTSEWMQTLFKGYLQERCRLWHAGIDIQRWPDVSLEQKKYDFLIYDKIRWEREVYEPRLLSPILELLRKNGSSYTMLRYRYHDHQLFRKSLKQSRSMLFLCEHETQGLAYQEALASNVPILAWDNGYWLDPQRLQYTGEKIPASAVPYFSELCGEKFRDIEEFPDKLAIFLKRLPGYRPREYVQKEFDLIASGRKYAEYYFSLLRT